MLVPGETGTSKELIAHTILNPNPTTGRPFVKLNCAAIPFDLLESGRQTPGAQTGEFRKELCYGNRSRTSSANRFIPLL